MDSLLPNLIFYVFAFIVLVSAVYTAFAPKLVHAAFSLLFTFLGLACIYIYLGADFVGITQIVIYVGGILVLLLFGVMFTAQESSQVIKQTLHFKWGIALLVLLFCLMIPAMMMTPWPVMDEPNEATLESTIFPVGEMLLTKYLLPFEIASLLLLIALIGAVVIARGEPKTPVEEEEEHSS